MLQKLLDILPVLLPALVAFNVVLSAVGSFLGAIHLNAAESFVGKLAGFLKQVLDFIGGNVAHK